MLSDAIIIQTKLFNTFFVGGVRIERGGGARRNNNYIFEGNATTQLLGGGKEREKIVLFLDMVSGVDFLRH